MGLGKTSITLTAIEQLIYERFEVSKVLVVAPLRVARNTWSDEIHKWDHLKHLKYSVVVGTAADRKKALQTKADIYIINRENLQWLIEQSGVPFFWDMVVLDELSSFKNWNSKRFKAFMQVRPKIKRVIGLTGTPSSNGLMDLFAEFKCLDMGERLGRFISQYRVDYFVPDRMNGPIVYSYKLRNGAEQRIYNRISDITISMKALDHLNMPELISTQYPVYMSDFEAELYLDMEKDLFLPLQSGEVTAANAATLSGKLMQMASQAYRIDDSINSKLEQVAALRELATKATSTISDMPGSPNRNICKMENAIVKITDLENEINEDIHELVSLKADITHMIKRVSDRQERTILEKRYLCFATWEQISVDMDYSIQHTFRLHDKALKEIDGFLKEES